MNKNQIAILCLCSLTMFCSSLVFADAITKPHTFSEGTPANASDVNENFDTVYNQTNKIGTEINIDTVNGRVGIGTASPLVKLHVEGGIKIGTETVSCSPGYGGALRFNTALREMEYCDGSYWKSLEPKTPIIWSGGCFSSSSLSGQWVDFCTDVTDYNNASSHMTVSSAGSITFLISGFYKINFHTSARGTTIIQARFTKNGTSVMQTQVEGAPGYHPIRMEKIIQFNAGDVLAVSSNVLGGSTVAYRAHVYKESGLQISYEGPSQ